jgi:hypothetical protein
MFTLLMMFFEYLDEIKCKHGKDPSFCNICINKRETKFSNKRTFKTSKQVSRKLKCEHGRAAATCYGCEINHRVESRIRGEV